LKPKPERSVYVYILLKEDVNNRYNYQNSSMTIRFRCCFYFALCLTLAYFRVCPERVWLG